jgi:hypothetical protein
VILTDHESYNFREILRSAKIVVDTRNATKGLDEFQDKIIKLGSGNHRNETTAKETGGDDSLAQSAPI